MNDIALRELVAKWRLLGDDMVTSDICSRAHFVRLHQCATELESILAAPQEAETPFAYFIDGPGGFWTCYRKDEVEPQIQEHCKANGEDAEDYTATAMYVHPAAPQAAPQDQPIDADDNAGYIEHCADILDKHGYRITGTTLRAIASVHRDLTTKAPQAAPAGMVPSAYQIANNFDAHRKGLPDEFQDWAAEISRDLRQLAAAPAAQVAEVAGLHPKTADLVRRFSTALTEKLADAEKKYGYSDGWSSSDWMDECRACLLEHVAKGDPRDVAAYCAFLWHHGERTAMHEAKSAMDTASVLRCIADAVGSGTDPVKLRAAIDRALAAAPAVVVDEAMQETILRTVNDVFVDCDGETSASAVTNAVCEVLSKFSGQDRSIAQAYRELHGKYSAGGGDGSYDTRWIQQRAAALTAAMEGK